MRGDPRLLLNYRTYLRALRQAQEVFDLKRALR